MNRLCKRLPDSKLDSSNSLPQRVYTVLTSNCHTFFLTHLLFDVSTPSRIDAFRLGRRRPNLALVFYVNFIL